MCNSLARPELRFTRPTIQQSHRAVTGGERCWDISGAFPAATTTESRCTCFAQSGWLSHHRQATLRHTTHVLEH